jgi:hypothetical protein
MMIAEAYKSSSRLFRRLKSGTSPSLYAARLVKDGLARKGTWRCLNVASGLVSWIASRRSKLTDLDQRISSGTSDTELASSAAGRATRRR